MPRNLAKTLLLVMPRAPQSSGMTWGWIMELQHKGEGTSVILRVLLYYRYFLPLAHWADYHTASRLKTSWCILAQLLRTTPILYSLDFLVWILARFYWVEKEDIAWLVYVLESKSRGKRQLLRLNGWRWSISYQKDRLTLKEIKEFWKSSLCHSIAQVQTTYKLPREPFIN